MKLNDLQNAPKAPKGFHNRLVQTLDSLPERKEGISMKRKNLTRLLTAAAIVAVITVTAIAGGRMLMITGHSYHGDDYQELPTAAWAEEKIGAEPKLLEQFSNGFTFDYGGITKNELTTEGNSQGKSYTSLDLTYVNKDASVTLTMNGIALSNSPDAEIIEKNSTTLYYSSFTHKVVPMDYEMTEEDEKAVENGTLVFGWGADKVETYAFQELKWEQNGVSYSLYGHDMELGRDDLTAMACELLAS